MGCNCPKEPSLTEIPDENCPVDLKQIQKIAFRRRGEIWDTAAGTPTDIKEDADWIVFIAAVDDTKIVTTPFIGGDPVIAPGEAKIEGGGDNSTLNGVELIVGTDPSKFSVKFNSMSPAQEKAFKALMCEPNALEVFFANGDDNIIATKGDLVTQHIGIPVQSMFVGDRSNDGFGTKDSNMVSFQMAAGWSEDIEVIVPNFSPLTLW